MKAVRLLAGLVLGGILVAASWYAGWVTPPESVARRVGLLATLYPASTEGAVIEPIPCPALPRLRFYVVCTDGCDGVWRILALKGLRTIQLANLARSPRESVTDSRRRINALIRDERVNVDDDQVRQLVEFYLRLDGLTPARLLTEADRLAVEDTRPAGEEALQELADVIAEGNPLARIPVDRDDSGIRSTVLYWDTSRRGWPVMEMRFRLGGFGDVRDIKVRQLSSSESEDGNGGA